MRYLLLALLTVAGCGTGQGDAPSVAGSWRFSLDAFDVHPACSGTVVFSERGPDSPQQVQGLQPGQTYVDGPWSCGDSMGLSGGTREENAIDYTMIVGEQIWLRARVSVDGDQIVGGGFQAVRQ